MLARSSGECGSCGNPGIVAGVTHVRWERQRGVYACEVCDESVVDETPTEDDEIDTKELRVRVLARVSVSADGQWCVYRVSVDGACPKWTPDGAKKGFSLAGPVGDFQVGDIISVLGSFGTHPRYGLQFKALAAGQLALTESQTGMMAFLSRLPNIGPARAQDILKRFGLKGTLEALDMDPARLSEVDGITLERVAEIKEAYDDTGKFRELRLFAARSGVPEYVTARAIEAWGDEALDTIREDPYALMQLARVGFLKADAIAKHLKVAPNDRRRCAALIAHSMESVRRDGHTFITEEHLLAAKGFAFEDVRKSKLTPEEISIGVKANMNERRCGKKFYPPLLVKADDVIYIRDLYEAERFIASDLERLTNYDGTKKLRLVEDWGDMTPSSEQKQALDLALSSNVMILTGSPGTGKTATVRALLNMYEDNGLEVSLCAPTGKAAKRLAKLTDSEASTIHRLIAHRETSSDAFRLEVDVVILDESSMCDIVTLKRLLSSLDNGTRLVLVGDVDQLPSVDPGRAFADIIESGHVPVTRLTQIFRQASDGETKRIPEFARAINEGKTPDLGLKGTDVVFMPCLDADDVGSNIVRAVTQLLPEKYGFKPDEIQVLSPQRGQAHHKNWAIGVQGLNHSLREVLNPPLLASTEVHIGEGYTARPADRVIQVENDYNLGVMNGEQGKVLRVEKDGFSPPDSVHTSLKAEEAKDGGESPKKRGKKSDLVSAIVEFDGGRIIGYTKDQLRMLQLSYAITVHKAQGDEARAIVMPVHKLHSWQLSRALLYTGVTRAREYCLLVGDADAIRKAVKNVRTTERRTKLREFLDREFVSEV